MGSPSGLAGRTFHRRSGRRARSERARHRASSDRSDRPFRRLAPARLRTLRHRTRKRQASCPACDLAAAGRVPSFSAPRSAAPARSDAAPPCIRWRVSLTRADPRVAGMNTSPASGRGTIRSDQSLIPRSGQPRQHRSMATWRLALCALVWAGLILGDPVVIAAQQRVRVDGLVQWLGATNMQVMTAGGTVPIDLRQADQGSYRGLRTGERVIVDGVLSSDRRMVVAQDIWRGGDGVESP